MKTYSKRRNRISENTAEIIAAIKQDDSSAIEELYEFINHDLRFFLASRLIERGRPSDGIDDQVQNLFLESLNSIKRAKDGHIEDLPAYLFMIARRGAYHAIKARKTQRKEFVPMKECQHVTDPSDLSDPFEIVAQKEIAEAAKRALSVLPNRDAEILTRFYLHAQPQSQILREMSITEGSFRTRKSRAKIEFGQIAREALAA